MPSPDLHDDPAGGVPDEGRADAGVQVADVRAAGVRAVLLSELGTLSDAEADHLQGGLDAAFVAAEYEKLRAQKPWLWGLAGAMVLLAILLPTGALYRFVIESTKITTTDYLAQTAAWCTYAGVQMAVAVYLLLRWRQRLVIYRALRALAAPEDEPEAPAPDAPASEATPPEASASEAPDDEGDETPAKAPASDVPAS